ncbi:MAG: DHH family phosphoesterase, partial [Lachnospiraceae bacterium]
MKKKIKYKGQFRIYIMWPLYSAILLLVLDIVLLTQNLTCAAIGAVFTLAYGVLALVFLFRKQSMLTKSMVEFASDYAQVQKTLLDDFKVPYGMLDENGKIIWLNREFKKLLHKDNAYRKNITSIFPDVNESLFDTDEDEFFTNIVYDGRDYRADFKRLAIGALMEENTLLKVKNTPSLIALYLFDETDMNHYLQELHDEQLVVGLIYIDNYDEALESIDELRRSLLAGLVERKISKYITNGNGIVKKLEKDKYFLVFRYKYLEDLRTDKFSILEDVKGTDIGNAMAVTLSIGIATGYDDFNSNYEMARAAIDLALGRGGDQAVIKEGEQTTFFGGKSTTVEKNTRVKARVKAHALRELIEVADNVIIMGHKISDADALGAAVGIYRAAKALNKHANIVLNDVTRSLRPTVETFEGVVEYEEDLFVKNSEVMQYVSDNTLLVVVDVNRPGYTECPELVDRCKTIVVLDHHRQSGDTIDHAVLSYIEPYASSTCEMVAEILQYIGDNVKLKAAEAN